MRTAILGIIGVLLAFNISAQTTSLDSERIAELEAIGLKVIFDENAASLDQAASAEAAAASADEELPDRQDEGLEDEAEPEPDELSIPPFDDQTEEGAIEQMPEMEADQTPPDATLEGQEPEESAAERTPRQGVASPESDLILVFRFDAGIQPDHAAGFGAGTKFERQSLAYLKDEELGEHEPRLVEGKFGKGLLLEQQRVNLLTRNQSDAENGLDGFTAVNGAELSISKDDCWQGAQSLKVVTPDNAPEEGFLVQVPAQKVFYDGSSIMPAVYVASLYVKGKGGMQLLLKEPQGETVGAPLFFELSDEWQQVDCCFEFDFKQIRVGGNLAGSWQNKLPPDTQVDTQLQLMCVTTDKQRAEFLVDALQLETRDLSDRRSGWTISPLTWLPGEAKVAQERFSFPTDSDYFNEWKRNGTVSFWFKPSWDAQNGGRETILCTEPGGNILDHSNSRLRMPHANVNLVPYEWKDQWHHIAITWDSEGGHALYVDGYDYQSARPYVNKAAKLLLFNGAASPNGVIDDLALFQTALTHEQIKEMAFEEKRAGD